MQGNGTQEKSPNVLRDMTDILADHVKLLKLEIAYESGLAARRLLLGVVTLILGMTAFILLQVALVMGLSYLGMPVWAAALLLAFCYGIMAGGLIWVYGRRPSDVGAPFEATQREFEESYRWIQKILS